MFIENILRSKNVFNLFIGKLCLLTAVKISKSSKCVFRCWSLKFKQSDHQFLHQSNVFHHINNILSKSDDGDSEESFSISVQSGFEVMNQASIPALAQKQRSFVNSLYFQWWCSLNCKIPYCNAVFPWTYLSLGSCSCYLGSHI